MRRFFARRFQRQMSQIMDGVGCPYENKPRKGRPSQGLSCNCLILNDISDIIEFYKCGD
jgi:hypothetical protein